MVVAIMVVASAAQHALAGRSCSSAAMSDDVTPRTASTAVQVP